MKSSITDLVLFEDEWLLAINKPFAVHSLSHSADDTSLEALLSPHIENVPEAGLLQRLDFFTTGIVLAAKDESVRNDLRQEQKQGKVQKKYLALLQGKLEESQDIETYLGSRYRRSKKVSVFSEASSSPARSRLAHTRFQPISSLADPRTSLAQVAMARGMRHQIRAHAAHLGFPLIGDLLYGASLSLLDLGIDILEDIENVRPATSSVETKSPGPSSVALAKEGGKTNIPAENKGQGRLGFDNESDISIGGGYIPQEGAFLLHAWQIAFQHPRTGAELVLEAEPPASFDQFQMKTLSH